VEILVVKMSALGDVIQALPVIPALKATFPGARIHWLVEEAAEPIVRLHPSVDRVLVSRRRRWGKDWRHPDRWSQVIEEVLGLVRQLRRPRYDLAIDFQGLMKSGVWMHFAEASRKVGFDGVREWGHIFLTERVSPLHPDLHAVERYLHLVAWIGGEIEGVDFGICPPPDARRRLRKVLQRNGWGGDAPYAVIVPTARWRTKRWEETSFAEVADRLAQDLDLRVAVTGVRQDRSIARGILRRMRHPAVDLAGETDVVTLMALLEGARVVVSVDSGPMHLAAALGTPVVALFGPTAPWRTGPYGRGHRVIRSPSSCSPCFRRLCSRRTCMDRIRPREVVEAVAEVVSREDGG
jgi:3-deoxy-D-manno-octulosonic-acid transferase/heptosyltransferase-1